MVEVGFAFLEKMHISVSPRAFEDFSCMNQFLQISSLSVSANFLGCALIAVSVFVDYFEHVSLKCLRRHKLAAKATPLLHDPFETSSRTWKFTVEWLIHFHSRR